MKLLTDRKLYTDEIKMAFRTTFSGIKFSASASSPRSEAALNDVEATVPRKTHQNINSIFKRKFKGYCRTCGNKGHKSADCWENLGIVINL
jgi:hypothetical protein